MTEVTAECREEVRPRAGRLYGRVVQMRVEGAKRHKLLALLAAYADAGEQAPPVKDLAKRLHLPPTAIDVLLDRLVEAGLLSVEWAGPGEPGKRMGRHRERNVYTLRLDRSS